MRWWCACVLAAVVNVDMVPIIGPFMSANWPRFFSHFQILLQELVDKHAKSIADHVAYNEALHKAKDWLTAAEQRLGKVALDSGDSVESVKRQLDLVKVMHLSWQEWLANAHKSTAQSAWIVIVSLLARMNHATDILKLEWLTFLDVTVWMYVFTAVNVNIRFCTVVHRSSMAQNTVSPFVLHLYYNLGNQCWYIRARECVGTLEHIAPSCAQNQYYDKRFGQNVKMKSGWTFLYVTSSRTRSSGD